MLLEQAILPQHHTVISAGSAGVISFSLLVEDRLPIVACLLNHHRKWHGHRPVLKPARTMSCTNCITVQMACGVIVSVIISRSPVRRHTKAPQEASLDQIDSQPQAATDRRSTPEICYQEPGIEHRLYSHCGRHNGFQRVEANLLTCVEGVS